MIADQNRFLQDSSMRRFVLVCLLLAPISVLANGGLPDKPYIYVKGMAGDEKSPDIVILRFDLVARAPDQPKANADVQARSTKVFSLLRERKVSDNDIVAEQIRSEADFEQAERYPRRGKLIGYVVTRQFSVKLRDVGAFPKLVDDLIAVANAEFTGIEGLFSKEKEIAKQLWDKAIADAREQAKRTAKELDMKVDSVFAVSPVTIPEIQSTMFPRTDERTVVTASDIPSQQDRVASEYRLAPVGFSQSVHVIYLISPVR
jgi:uncharacterized protein YggE